MNFKIEPIEQYKDLRSAFIDKFICQASYDYYEHIDRVTFQNNVPYYTGFLWEFFYHNQSNKTNSVLITEEEGIQILDTKDSVLFMFDYFKYSNEW